jgi:hypothetical protein
MHSQGSRYAQRPPRQRVSSNGLPADGPPCGFGLIAGHPEAMFTVELGIWESWFAR